MEKTELDLRITEVSRTILSYCMARTSSQYDAEDLAQDIILGIMESAPNIRDDRAFYGFMWSVAGNIYRKWCRKKHRRSQFEFSVDEVSGEIPEDAAEPADASDDITLLRRELSLLRAKYRRATVLYYIEGKSCAEIAAVLSLSESMVKYLLFKSRKILLEGMTMERNYGEQSYNPGKMSLMFWGSGSNRYFNLCDKKIAQNILLACYNDALSEQDISLALGVAVPYLEDELAVLLEYGLLRKSGSRYQTNVVIFTKEFTKEVDIRAARVRREIADIVKHTLGEREAAIRQIGFTGTDMDRNTFLWQFTCILLYRAVIQKLQGRIGVEYPTDKFGVPCFVWGQEDFEGSVWQGDFGFGISDMENSGGDRIQFMDIPINGEMVHHYCFSRQGVTNVFLDIAGGRTEKFSENDWEDASDMVRRGYVVRENGSLRVNTPVFTKAQFEEILTLLDPAADAIAEKAEELMRTVTEVLLNHTPAYLRDTACKMGFLRLFEDAISAPLAMLYRDGVLKKADPSAMLPTTYVILN